MDEIKKFVGNVNIRKQIYLYKNCNKNVHVHFE